MTEKDVELQELRDKVRQLKEELSQYQDGLNWTRDKLIDCERKLDICKSDLYKAVVYDCCCSLCAKMPECVKSDNEITQYDCFMWRYEK